MINELLRRIRFPESPQEDDHLEFGNSMIPMPLYQSFRGMNLAHEQKTAEYRKANETARSAGEKFYELQGLDSSSKEAEEAYDEWQTLDSDSSLKWRDTHETRSRVDLAMREISLSLVQKHWRDLSPMERRAVDIQASDHQIVTPLIHGVVSGLISGQRIADEATLVKTDAKVSGFDFQRSEIYGSNDFMRRKQYEPDVAHAIGAETFGRQRALAHFVPEMLPDLLGRIPQEYTINRHAVASYLQNVVCRCRAHIVDSFGIKMAVEPHIGQPYSDSEWEEGLTKQKETAPQIATALASECPSLIAVTMYGPITREDKNHIMFHPETGLQLGACFTRDDPERIDRAIDVAQEEGKRLGVKVRTGTGQGGAFGGAFYTWNFATESDISSKLDDLDMKGTRIFGKWTPNFLSDTSVEQLLELQFQLLDGTPLVIREKESFRRIRHHLQRYKKDYSNPIFQRARFLYDHFEKGYPYPIEYKGPRNIS